MGLKEHLKRVLENSIEEFRKNNRGGRYDSEISQRLATLNALNEFSPERAVYTVRIFPGRDGERLKITIYHGTLMDAIKRAEEDRGIKKRNGQAYHVSVKVGKETYGVPEKYFQKA